MDVEAKNLGLIKIDLRRHNNCVREMLKEHMGKACTEVCTVNVDLSEFGEIDLFAARAIDLETRGLQSVAETNGQHFLLITESSGAEAVDTR